MGDQYPACWCYSETWPGFVQWLRSSVWGKLASSDKMASWRAIHQCTKQHNWMNSSEAWSNATSYFDTLDEVCGL